jgi:Zn-dependent M28 family amino/carboxypeptidase
MRKSLIAATCVALAVSVGYGTFVWGAVGVDSSKLRNAVTVPNIRLHQKALQLVADGNGSTRASGTPGFGASVAYVRGKLEAAGYTVTELPFQFPYFQENSPPVFDVTVPDLPAYVEGQDFFTMSYSGSGDPTAVLQKAGGIVLPPGANPSTSASGCTAADFAGFVPGNIALIQRGTCTFALKAQNALAAGASAAIIFNEGQPGRQEALQGTLGGPIALPVIGASFAVGDALAAMTPGPTIHIKTDTISELRNTSNLMAETTGRSDRVVVVGAHLDSVAEGPGIQDNGSGSASNLELAIQMKKQAGQQSAVHVVWRRRSRTAWFGKLCCFADRASEKRHRTQFELRYDRLTQLCALRL